MFDPNKYDNNDSDKGVVVNDNANEFIAQRARLIKNLENSKSLIIKECESLERYLHRTPEGNAANPFREKLGGWSKILNGIDVISKMYSNTH